MSLKVGKRAQRFGQLFIESKSNLKDSRGSLSFLLNTQGSCLLFRALSSGSSLSMQAEAALLAFLGHCQINPLLCLIREGLEVKILTVTFRLSHARRTFFKFHKKPSSAECSVCYISFLKKVRKIQIF